MDEVDEATEQARVSRRRALKTGAALGVGVTAWAGPQIGRMGATPAYAAACTVPFSTVIRSDCKSSSCPDQCTTGTSKFIKLGDLAVSGTVNKGTVSAIVPATKNGNACAGPTLRGQAKITVPTTTGQCRLLVEVFDGNVQCNNRDLTKRVGFGFTDSVLAGKTGNVDLPSVPCASGTDTNSNLFYSLTIECTSSTSANCT